MRLHNEPLCTTLHHATLHHTASESTTAQHNAQSGLLTSRDRKYLKHSTNWTCSQDLERLDIVCSNEAGSVGLTMHQQLSTPRYVSVRDLLDDDGALVAQWIAHPS
ncbi:hypothetical protein PoB_001351500 [Plakobranchus ocellatus]|uniref:SRCR domain-containing protein n=1 Tax=Plakobranchus ocellatus TaxID=259542 RepID=A0AAV3YX16_9GAST|nr:hypothetical protein PoB_001351500 [Plakobranchus ocellatus]